MTEDATMVASGETPPPEDSQLGQLQLKQQPDQDKRTKGKIVQKKRGRGAAAVQEEVPLTAAQADHVRVVRADAKRDAAGDERAQPIVLLSKVGRAPQLQLSDDRLSVSGTKGYRTVRATHGAYQGGSWYCEVTITHLGASGHVRLGWCTNKAELQAPVGFDTFGFSYRDIDGSKVSDGLRLPYGKPFKEGDVVGLLIHMPDGGRPFEVLDRAIARYKGTLYLVAEPATEPQPLQGSAIAFTMNGELQGVAFSNVLEGTYYPAASLYTLPDQQKGAMVSYNFGPNFKYPLPQLEGCPPAQPCSNLPQANQPASVTPAVKAEVAADAPKDTPVQPMDTA